RTSLSISAFNSGSLRGRGFVDPIRGVGWQRVAKYSHASGMRRRMNADRWRAGHEGIDQLRDGRLPPERSFHGGKTTSVFEFVPEEDRQWFAWVMSSYVIRARSTES